MRRLLAAAVRTVARILVARIEEQMRDVQPMVGWLLGGVLAIAALPAVAVLLMGYLLQTALLGPLAAGETGIRERGIGRLGRAELGAALAEAETPRVWSWPVMGRLTTGYGGCTFAMCPHWGIDIASAPDTPVLAATDGVVAAIGWDPNGYGHFVILAHGGGWRTLYAHLSRPDLIDPQLKLNDSVRRGEPIGGIGSSGASTGPHLHLEMWRNGTHVDPIRVLRN